MAPPPRKRRLKPTRRQALELLAGARHGATEHRMLVHGFTRRMQTGLVRSGLALRYRISIRVGGRTIEVTYMMITVAGRRALEADWLSLDHIGRGLYGPGAEPPVVYWHPTPKRLTVEFDCDL